MASAPFPRPLSKNKAAQLYDRLASANPDPRTELDYVNPFTLVVAVALSAQATDKSVNKATSGLFAIADTPEKMAALGEEGVAAHIKTIGLWRNKAKNVIALSRLLLEQHNGEVPSDRAALEALPGVGRKTANVVLAEAFGAATIAVDTHVFRVANRTGLAPGKTPEQVEAGLMKVTPPARLRAAHHWLILHGRYTCLARKPRCAACVISDLCKFPEKPGVQPAKAAAKARAKGSAAAGTNEK
jgi:endonuclease-3